MGKVSALLGVIIIVAGVLCVSTIEYNERVAQQGVSKYDPVPQITRACEKFVGGY